MVHFNHVSKIYDNKIAAVSDVEFKIEKGEYVFLIGPSGSGKTTIIKMLIRDEVPSDGKIFFNDADITKISRQKVYKLRREIGVIFQDFKLVQDKTAFENVAFAMEAAGKSDKDIKETVPYVLDIVGLSNRMNAFPRQLSGGEQQRVAIARAISNNPKILIADEPTGNLDPASAWDIVQVLSKINNWGTTVIMSTHGTDIVNSLNKRVVQMDGGRVIRDDNKGQYEMTEKFEDSALSNLEKREERKERKSTFVTTIPKLESTEEKVVEEKQEKKGGLLGRIFKRKKKQEQGDKKQGLMLVQEPEQEQGENVEKTKKREDGNKNVRSEEEEEESKNVRSKEAKEKKDEDHKVEVKIKVKKEDEKNDEEFEKEVLEQTTENRLQKTDNR